MNKGYRWIQKKENRIICLQAVVAMMLPFLSCFVYCLLQGKSIGQVYLPCSEWNDELFYFKQVEGMVKYGFPQGYFGFNESHAIKLSFAAWSPVLVFPWVIWGKLFGWTLLSPVICNLVLMAAAMGIFVFLTRIDWKREIVLSLLFFLFTPFVRYLLSGMPEIICFSMLIVFYGIAVRELREHSVFCMILLFLMGVVMTLMRPYLILFLCFPCLILIKRNWKIGLAVSVFALGSSVGLYGLIKHYLGAEYFADLFFTDWVKAYFEKGIFGGMRYTLGKLYYMGKAFGIHLIEGFRSGMASGAFFAGFITMMGILFWQTIIDLRACLMSKSFSSGKLHKDQKASIKEQNAITKESGMDLEETNAFHITMPDMLLLEAHLLVSFIGMFFALLLMYKLTEGSKHLLTFIATGIFVVVGMQTKRWIKPLILGVVFFYFYVIMARAPYDYQVPFVQEDRQKQIEFWQEQAGDKLKLQRDAVPNYDNVVIWVLSDKKGGEQNIMCPWQLLYALPEGMGISCCTDEYVWNHFTNLKSKYLVTLSGGDLDLAFQDQKALELIRDEDYVLYQLR